MSVFPEDNRLLAKRYFEAKDVMANAVNLQILARYILAPVDFPGVPKCVERRTHHDTIRSGHTIPFNRMD